MMNSNLQQHPGLCNPRHLDRLKLTLAIPFLLSLTACDGLARFTTKPESKPEPVVSEQKPAPEQKQEPEAPLEVVKLKPSPLYEWNGDSRRVSRIVIDTDQQKARFYAGNDEIGWSTVATGVAKYPTPTGQFTIIEKVENKRSNLYGKVYGKGGAVIKSSVRVGLDPIPSGARFEGSSMPFYMRLTGDGVGMHAGPIPHPGQPASHGCIRLPSKLASALFTHVSNGTQVSIVGRGPDYGNYAEKQRAIAARQAAEQRQAAAKKAAEAAAAANVAPSTPPQTPNTATPQPAILAAPTVAPTPPVVSPPAAPTPGQIPASPAVPAAAPVAHTPASAPTAPASPAAPPATSAPTAPVAPATSTPTPPASAPASPAAPASTPTPPPVAVPSAPASPPPAASAPEKPAPTVVAPTPPASAATPQPVAQAI